MPVPIILDDDLPRLMRSLMEQAALHPDGCTFSITLRPGALPQWSVTVPTKKNPSKERPWTLIRRALQQGAQTRTQLMKRVPIPDGTMRRELAQHRSEVVNLNPGGGRGNIGIYELKEARSISGNFQDPFI